jgi:hypothetical protein
MEPAAGVAAFRASLDFRQGLVHLLVSISIDPDFKYGLKDDVALKEDDPDNAARENSV